MSYRPLLAVVVPAAGALLALGALPLAAADLIEPWEPGLSDLELSQSWDDESGWGETAAVIGFGAGAGLSLGLAATRGDDRATRFGAVAVLTLPRAPGDRHELDLWLETGVVVSSSIDLEQRDTELTFGGEWSYDTTAGSVPYARLSLSHDGTTQWHALAGLMIPAGERLALHVELSSEEPDAGPWPLHLAVGPNLCLHDGIELVPELSLIREGGTGATRVVLMLGLVVDPHAF